MYIAFEGHDGSGKTSTAQALAEKLTAMGKDCLFIRAPGTTKFGSFIRNTWHPNERVRYLQFLAHHVELLEDVIAPHLAKGGWVVQDRTYISSIVYSWGIIPDYVLLSPLYDWIRLPDKLFVLQCPIEVALERLAGLSKDLPDPDTEELSKIKLRYEIEAKALGACLISTTLPQEDVLELCLGEVNA